MSASEGLRIISMAKTLESYQRDHNITRYFAATQLAGRAGNFVSSLRNQDRVSWGKFIAHAANACLDPLTVKTHVLPWLKSNGFVDVGPGEKPNVSCNVVDHNAILRSTSSLFRSLDPTPEEIAVLGLLEKYAVGDMLTQACCRSTTSSISRTVSGATSRTRST